MIAVLYQKVIIISPSTCNYNGYAMISIISYNDNAFFHFRCRSQAKLVAHIYYYYYEKKRGRGAAVQPLDSDCGIYTIYVLTISILS